MTDSTVAQVTHSEVEVPLVMNVREKFSFRKQRVTTKGPDGKDVDVLDDKGNPTFTKRDALELAFQMPTLAGIWEAVSSHDKVGPWLLSIVKDAITDQIRANIDEIKSQADLNPEVISLEYIASIPPSERKGGGIPKELWDAFAHDYVQVIVENTDRKPEQAERAADIFVKRLNTVRTSADKVNVLNFLEKMLSVWIDKSERLEEFGDIAEYFMGKEGQPGRIATLRDATPEKLLEGL